MWNLKLLPLLLLAALPLKARTEPAKDAPDDKVAAYDGDKLAARQLLSEMLGKAGQKTVRGVKSLWVDVVLQKRAESPAMKTLADDLQMTELEGRLGKAGFRVLGDDEKPMALGSRKPTLVVMVLYAPAHSVADNPKPFYEVVTVAKLDTACLGSEKKPMVTWAHVGTAIPSDGDDAKDAFAIRESAREGIKAFVDEAKKAETQED